jgi:hypothetical protein
MDTPAINLPAVDGNSRYRAGVMEGSRYRQSCG